MRRSLLFRWDEIESVGVKGTYNALGSFVKSVRCFVMKQGSAGSMIRRGVDSTDGGICVRQSPKEGLEVRSFRMVERPSDLGASVGETETAFAPYPLL
jgi:hypothetical protein